MSALQRKMESSITDLHRQTDKLKEKLAAAGNKVGLVHVLALAL